MGHKLNIYIKKTYISQIPQYWHMLQLQGEMHHKENLPGPEDDEERSGEESSKVK